MKKKDIFYLIVSVIIIAGAVVLGLSQLTPKTNSQVGVSVEVIAPISPNLDNSTIVLLQDFQKTRDFATPIDLGANLGNPTLFGSF